MTIDPQTIIRLCAEFWHRKPAEITSKRRFASVVMPRHAAMFLIRQHTSMSLEEIGGLFGGRDHTTVLHALRMIAQQLLTDPVLAQALAYIMKDFADTATTLRQRMEQVKREADEREMMTLHAGGCA